MNSLPFKKTIIMTLSFVALTALAGCWDDNNPDSPQLDDPKTELVTKK